MVMAYFRRFRMELDFSEVNISEPTLPGGYRYVPWHPSLLDRHAVVKHHSFQSEIDSRVFNLLGDFNGCRRLMREITSQESFFPEATWLITYQPINGSELTDCGTIQGLAQSRALGAVQNVGIVPEHRGIGLGRAVLLKALAGFQKAKLRHVYLEVTAENQQAVKLYRSVGFRLTRTMYKAVEAEKVARAHYKDEKHRD